MGIIIIIIHSDLVRAVVSFVKEGLGSDTFSGNYIDLANGIVLRI